MLRLLACAVVVVGIVEGAGAGPLVEVRLLADAERVGPSQTFHLAVVFKLEPKWHVYWKNPGEGAMPPKIAVTAPDGFQVGATLWPRPTIARTPVGLEYCYYDEVVLFVPITTPAELSEGRVTFETEIDWAVCREVCRLGDAQRRVVVETSSVAAVSGDRIDPIVAKYRRRLPKPLNDLDGASVSYEDGVLTIRGPGGGHAKARFLPDESPGVQYGVTVVEIHDDRFKVTVAIEVNKGNALGKPLTLGGLVALGEKSHHPCYDFTLSLDKP